MKIVVYEDPEQCRKLWETMWPNQHFFDLWQVRSCFHKAFERPISFHVAEHNNKKKGFLPLCWNEENDSYVYFPGETWFGKTWIEQNRLAFDNIDILKEVLNSIPESFHLRYISQSPFLNSIDLTCEDEVGYCFFPGAFDFSFDKYWQSFASKSRKKIKADLKRFESRKVEFRFNQNKDLEQMFDMNIKAFGQESYFMDPRFYNSFDKLASFLNKMGMLRITTVMIDGAVAAIDMGAVWNNTYTVLAGGTNPEFVGVAKLINLHHIEWSCSQQFSMVDFLCGDFNWKQRFHLSPRPLYKIAQVKQGAGKADIQREARAAVA